ncbi:MULTISPECIES: DUF4179 domain-containing protein [Bacillales]|uniref:DUF4179 domain-containing protein n=1 Tax=Lysinibacillus halotolerans TaxID=1368476 RepID=A0A3M8HDK2_9BACI|nr:DUF4179 domain-containing protein [Lysinibacillus halotolerans]RND00335.1 DUF4179 domain-containing protein [Lysinibacillus halotolerans]
MNEKDFDKLKEELTNIVVPTEKLASMRHNGYAKYKKRQKRNRLFFKQVALIAVVVIIFVSSIRVSPAFANAVAKIPGFAPLVEMLTKDKGLKDIVDNEYFEELNIVQTKNNITLTILGTIADETGIVIFYELEAPFNISNLETKEFQLSQNGEVINSSSTSGWPYTEPTKTIQGKLEVIATSKIDYSKPDFEIYLKFDDTKETSFTIPFTLTKPIQPSKVYDVNKPLKIDGQTIYVQSLTISPLRAELKLKVNSQNTMQILQIDHLKVLDEKGEEWGKVQDGLVGLGSFREETNSIFIQSNYFRKPNKITLVLDQIEALPKGEDYVEIDFLRQKIVKVPPIDDFDLKILDSNSIEVTYKSKEDHHVQLFSDVIDAEGNQFYHNSFSVYENHNRFTESSYHFDLKGAVNPVQIYFFSYPHYLEGSTKVEIPLTE